MREHDVSYLLVLDYDLQVVGCGEHERRYTVILFNEQKDRPQSEQ
jgi:hypothetical protein